MNKLDTIACITDTVTKILTSQDKILLHDLGAEIKRIKNIIVDNDYKNILKAYGKIKYLNSELIFTDNINEDNYSSTEPKNEAIFFLLCQLIPIDTWMFSY